MGSEILPQPKELFAEYFFWGLALGESLIEINMIMLGSRHFGVFRRGTGHPTLLETQETATTGREPGTEGQLLSEADSHPAPVDD
jgi:hypothetical protein